jgi:sodium-dependent dicarboxylate transporter 2/3/5
VIRQHALWIGPVAGLAAAGLAAPLGAPAAWTAGVTAVCALWWVLEPVHLAVTALLPFVVLGGVGVLDAQAAAAAYGHPLILLLLGGALMSGAMESSGAHRRLALGVLRAVGGGGRRLVFGVLLAAAALSMWISNTATVLMLVPVILAILEGADRAGPHDLGPRLLLALAWGASIGGLGTPVGTPPNVIFLGALGELGGRPWTFLEYMTLGLPCVAVLVPLAALWLGRGLGPAPAPLLPTLGPWRPAERRTLVVFGLTAAAWVLRDAPAGGWSGALNLPGASEATVGLAGALALMLLPDGAGGRLLPWAVAERAPWGLLLLFAGGIALAGAFQASGLGGALGGWLADGAGLHRVPDPVAILVICLIVTFLTEVTSNTAITALLMPILGAAAVSAGVRPELWMAPAALSASCAFMLPVATAPNAVVFGTGRIPAARMAREGLVFNLLAAVAIAGVCSLRL